MVKKSLKTTAVRLQNSCEAQKVHCAERDYRPARVHFVVTSYCIGCNAMLERIVAHPSLVKYCYYYYYYYYYYL